MGAAKIELSGGIGIVKRAVFKEGLSKTELIQVQSGIIVEIAGVEFGFFVVKIVVGSSSFVFGKSPTIKVVKRSTTSVGINNKIATAAETKIAIVVAIEGVLAFKFAIILPVDAGLVDVVAISDEG